MTKLKFAPLIRVSMESQERQGESLRVQKDQLTRAIESLNGEVFEWYEGQEHATPDYERHILEKLMADAQARKFDALMVADISRWSRDNGKSKDYIKLLKKAGIRFYEGASELDLFNPTHSFVLGMGVEVAEFFAKQQKHKSILSLIARAKKNFPCCGKKPFGRIWDKETKTWKIDKELQAKIQQVAKLYLEGDYSWPQLGKMFGMHFTKLHRTLCYRSGTEWEVHFKAADFNIDETYTLTIPRLLPDETIQAIRAKCEARRTWDFKTQKHHHLFSRLIFDAASGNALTGYVNHCKTRYYRPYQGIRKPEGYNINAEILEKAVLEELFLTLGSKDSLQQAVFGGNPLGKVADKIKEDLQSKRDELTQVERQLEGYVTAIGTADDVVAFMERMKPRIVELEARSKGLKSSISDLEYRFATLPDEAEIEAKRNKWAGLVKRGLRSYLETGVALHQLPFEAQKKIIRLIFGGKDETGRRYGIYITNLGGTPKRFSFEAYGKLGAITGWLEGKSFSSYSDIERDDKELTEGISRVIMDGEPEVFGEKSDNRVHIINKCH